jgi:2-desacetyl-2-hydroxyethyl bacteriochlorophyllide A dehydrogenase
VWFVGPRRVEIRPTDVETGADRVVVRTLVSGISVGTELLAYRGGIDAGTPLDDALGAFGGTFAFPFRYGYACVGVVQTAGGPVEAGSIVFAFHPHQDLFAVGAADIVPVADVDPAVATMLPLVETALQVSLDADARPHEVAVVTGLGVVGALTAVLLRRGGVDVLGVDPREDRRKLAADLGIPAVEPDEAAEAIRERTPAGADVVVEASGAGEALASSLALLRHEGTAVVASWYGSRDVALPLGGAFHRRRLTIRSSQVSTIPARLSGSWDRQRRLRTARDLLSELPLDALPTRRFAFEDAAAAYDALDRGEPHVAHAVLEYP